MNVLDHDNDNVTLRIACSTVLNFGFFACFILLVCIGGLLKLNMYLHCKQNKYFEFFHSQIMCMGIPFRFKI